MPDRYKIKINMDLEKEELDYVVWKGNPLTGIKEVKCLKCGMIIKYEDINEHECDFTHEEKGTVE